MALLPCAHITFALSFLVCCLSLHLNFCLSRVFFSLVPFIFVAVLLCQAGCSGTNLLPRAHITSALSFLVRCLSQLLNLCLVCLQNFSCVLNICCWSCFAMQVALGRICCCTHLLLWHLHLLVHCLFKHLNLFLSSCVQY